MAVSLVRFIRSRIKAEKKKEQARPVYVSCVEFFEYCFTATCMNTEGIAAEGRYLTIGASEYVLVVCPEGEEAQKGRGES